MAAARNQVLSIYKKMLRESQKFTGYNHREYALRRVKSAFRDHKVENDNDKVQQLIKQANENLSSLSRQVALSQLYKEPTLIIEKVHFS